MRFTSRLTLFLSTSLISGLLFAKPLPTKYSEMQNGHVTQDCLKTIQADSQTARETLEPARYEAIVKDPTKATSDAERIAALAAREIIYLVDRIGNISGCHEYPTGQKRPKWTLWDSALEAGKSLFEVAVSLDKDGKLDVMLWDQDHSGPRFVHQEISKLADLEAMFKNNQPFGYTPLAEALEQVYSSKLKGMLERSEPFTVIVLSDGVPSNGSETSAQAQEKVFAFFKKMVTTHKLTEQGRETLVAFSFVQAGDDKGAEAFLTALDDKMKDGYVDSMGKQQSGLGVDIVDYKKDNFIFGTGPYKGVQGVGPLGIFWGALFD